MIYLLYGNDEIKSRLKYDELLAMLSAKNPTAGQFKLNSENFTPEVFEELTKGQGLFYQKIIVGCDNLLDKHKDNQGLADQVRPLLAGVASSDNIFIFLENRIATEDLKTLKALSGKNQEFRPTLPETIRTGFNIFTITDALAARNKNRLWTLYREALWCGLSPEEIFWKLVWQVNNLRLVKQTTDLSKLKMKDYALNKTKMAAKNFSLTELNHFSSALVQLYHQDYLGTDEFEFGLEKLILSV